MVQAAWCRKTPEFRTPAGVTINWSNAHIGITNVGLGIFYGQAAGPWRYHMISRISMQKKCSTRAWHNVMYSNVGKQVSQVQFNFSRTLKVLKPHQSIAQLQWHMVSFAKHGQIHQDELACRPQGCHRHCGRCGCPQPLTGQNGQIRGNCISRLQQG